MTQNTTVRFLKKEEEMNTNKADLVSLHRITGIRVQSRVFQLNS